MANNMQLSFLNDLKPHKTAWRIQVKILHSWRFFMKGVGESMELILSDAHGTKIHASCKKTYMADLAKHVRVGAWRNIDHFCVSGAGNGAYRSTGHKYRLAFIHSTKISESTLRDDNMFLNIVDFDSIQSGLLDSNFLIDVFGQVLDLGDPETIQCTGGKQRKKLEFSLVNVCGQKLACCLWGKFAENLHSVCQETEGIVLCLLRFAKIGQYRGEVQISNAFDASQLFINPEIAEADEFKQSRRKCKKTRQKWSQYPFRTIQEMKHMDKVGSCRVICTVYAIDTTSGWYYFACVVCNNKVFKAPIVFDDLDESNWWCEWCQCSVRKAAPRYKLALLVQDLTGESNFNLLDSAATFIVKTSAAKVVNQRFDEIGNQEMLPPEIVDIVGKTYGFGISFDESNSSCGTQFNAKKVWNLTDIMWKRIKSLHQISTSSKKKQCLNVDEVENKDHGEAKEDKSG
ncbi:unnamed protein product [Brassica oleracea var. botrytis]